MDDRVLVPPLNFAMVVPTVYRSGYPNKKNHPFLKKLGLRTVVYLCPDEISPENYAFFRRESIRIHQFAIQGNKEPFSQMDHEMIGEVLKIILEPASHPVLVHCNKGKHRVGCVMGILRKLQNWSITSIFDEYRRFAGNKTRIADQELIEAYDGPVEIDIECERPWLF